MARKKRGVPEINAGSMADIAFLLLIFFLVTTTMDVDTGIARKLPQLPEEDQPQDDSQIKDRNVYTVLVNAFDQLLVEEEPMDISQLREGAKRFLSNNGVREDLSENPQKAIISLQNDRGTSYEMYITVQNELAAAHRELRDEEAQSVSEETIANWVRTIRRKSAKCIRKRYLKQNPKRLDHNVKV